MPGHPIENEVDRLYQLSPDEFTAARNALAKSTGGDAGRIKALPKPSLPAWAVNQVFWQDRKTYDALISASTRLRGVHRAILAGKQGDIRAATKEHDVAVASGIDRALTILSGSGHRATDQTRQAIMTTLRALPADEPPGRLTHTLQPGGFEMLTGLPVAAAKHADAGPRKSAAPPTAHARAGTHGDRAAAPARNRAEERRALEMAARRLREAEHAARRQEFERARAVREADKAASAVKAAREALAEAQQALEEAEQVDRAAQRALEAAEKRASAAESAVAAARRATPS